MKYLEFGGELELAPDSTKTFDTLPKGFYHINYVEQHKRYSLVRTSPLIVTEKVYGIHEEKVNKVIKAFKRSTRSLGVILSGDKGIGKSLFARMLCYNMYNLDYPILVMIIKILMDS